MKGMLNKKTLTLVFLLLLLPLLVGCLPLKNQSPIITSTPITLAEVNELYTYEVEATDPDGDTLTYSLDVKPSGMTINSATGLIKWIPTAEGDYDVVVKVSDGTLDITQSFTIVVIEAEEPGWTPTPPITPPAPPFNHAPTINSIPGDTAIVGVEYTYTITATDPEGDPIIYSLVFGPEGMDFDAPATISWTPTEGQIGPNSVTVKASDGKKDATQNFEVVVVENQPPTADAGPNRIIVTKALPLEINLIGSGTDPFPGAVVSYSWDFGDGDTGTGAKVSHNYDILGTYEITLTVTDNAGATDSDIMILKIFDTIQEAINAAIPVNLVEVMTGTYDESVNINKSLTLQGEDRETTEIKFGYGSYPSDSPLTISADGVTVSGFTIRSGPLIEPAWTLVVKGNYALLTDLHVVKELCLDPNRPINKGAAILLGTPVGGSGVGGVDSFTFTDSIVDSAWNGIYAPRSPGSSNIVVRNVDFTYPGEYAILLMIVTGATIEDNTFICTADQYGVIVTRGSDSIEIVDNEFIGSGSPNGSHVGILLQAYATGTMGDITILNNGISSFNTGILVENVATSGTSIHDNNIYNNLSYGINYLGLDTVDATNNWWGDVSGPYHATTNPGGLGDAVSDYVDFDPWSDSPN